MTLSLHILVISSLAVFYHVRVLERLFGKLCALFVYYASSYNIYLSFLLSSDVFMNWYHIT